MANRVLRALVSVLFFAYGLFTLFLYGLQAILAGRFFSRTTEKEVNELKLARDRFWNLSKEFCGLSHQFLTLRNGFKFHYLTSVVPGSATAARSNKPLVILIHGFPDSWAVWRHIVSSPAVYESSILAAVDLPGYGGSDGLDEYSATNVLENLTEFIISLREQYGIETPVDSKPLRKVIVVGHDWGCVLAMRLAAEAPQVADRFILSNGPLPGLVASNVRRLLSSAFKMFKTALNSPLRSRSTFVKALKTLIPVFRQLRLSGYIFVMKLPIAFVRYLGSGGNYSFLKSVHKIAHGEEGVYTTRDAAESMASTLGPSAEECKTKTPQGEPYPVSVEKERVLGNFEHMARYYREGAAVAPWNKSLETIASLHSINRGSELRRSTTGKGLFDDGPDGVLKTQATVIWGQKDSALEPHLCLDGISDYLDSNSQVIMLPRTGHFTPVEKESRGALELAIEWAVKGEKEDIGSVVSIGYPGAVVTVRK
ncbi:hypothetical protein Plec18167_005303 [Paecilomyces lecythidis]|uniref:AB hydrolase-1 domain-containing protein n=1 Tax=Paecilomyces lecythidis TaxID=3004212 RepID=A0ABR3XK03_9EURO